MKEPIKLSDFEGDLLTLIRTKHKGRKAATNIAAVINAFPEYRLTQRRVKRAIEHIHEAGYYFFGSSRHVGLFWIRTEEEFAACWRPYILQSISMSQMGRAAQRAARATFSTQEKLFGREAA
jgi:hypothetical protein